MIKRVLLSGLLNLSVGARVWAEPMPEGAAAVSGPARNPLQGWEWEYETGIAWHITGSATPLNYALLPQILSVKTPEIFGFRLGAGEIALRSRYSILIEPILVGPEHHYFGVSGSGILEWWDQARTRCLFFSSGGGFGELDSKGYQIAGAQGQEFNLNWFAYPGVRVRYGERMSASLGAYFQHISNGHLDKVDPGLNTLGPMLSLGWHF